MESPKLFISYSWSNPDHEAWILQLATELRESGVDVILDKWDLKEGHDANAFMEKMVSDPSIKKVALICDKMYAEKTDGRRGGVGTEAQIISAEIYAKQVQDKFVAVVRERDSEGKACLPTYYKSRIYIDLSDPSDYAKNFERLLRWIYDRPLYEKPAIGTAPIFVDEGRQSVSLGTTSRFKRALDAIKNSRPNAIPAFSEYCDVLVAEFEKLRLDPNADPFDDAVVASIESFLPYRNEAIELFLALALYEDSRDSRSTLHRFFERLIPYIGADNFKFLVHELFLYSIASLIRRERFEAAAHLMATDYYVPGNSDYGRDVMVSFKVFRSYMRSLERRNERLKLRRLSVRADMLEQRCKGVGVEFRDLMQADFVLFLRDHLDHPDQMHWWPETLLYADRHSAAFEIFARSKSSAYFERVKILLGINSKDALSRLLKTFTEDPRSVPTWEFESFSPAALLGFNDLATKP
jgi:hypothetical protein